MFVGRAQQIMLKLSSFILPIWSLSLKSVAYIFPFIEFYFAELEHWHQYRVGRMGFKRIFDNVQHATSAVCFLMLLG